MAEKKFALTNSSGLKCSYNLCIPLKIANFTDII